MRNGECFDKHIGWRTKTFRDLAEDGDPHSLEERVEVVGRETGTRGYKNMGLLTQTCASENFSKEEYLYWDLKPK